MINGSKVKLSTEVKHQNVEGEGVGDPSKQPSEGAAQRAIDKDQKAPVPLKMHSRKLVQVQGALFA